MNFRIEIFPLLFGSSLFSYCLFLAKNITLRWAYLADASNFYFYVENRPQTYMEWVMSGAGFSLIVIIISILSILLSQLSNKGEEK